MTTTQIPNSSLKRSAIKSETRKCKRCGGRGCRHCWRTGYHVGPETKKQKRRAAYKLFVHRSGLGTLLNK